MTTIVGIFDNARNLDRAVEQLARAGFEDTVYDVAIVAGETVNSGGPVGLCARLCSGGGLGQCRTRFAISAGPARRCPDI
jgi:hypothetical protein